MIFSSARGAQCLCGLPAAIQSALNWLREHDAAHMEPGIYELQGRDMYINLQDITTRPAEDCRPERHDEYLDIQYVVSGTERMGFVPYTGKETVQMEVKERDVTLYQDLEGESFVDVGPGEYCIFFSNDIHRPGCAAGEPGAVRKAVAKIRQSLIK